MYKTLLIFTSTLLVCFRRGVTEYKESLYDMDLVKEKIKVCIFLSSSQGLLILLCHERMSKSSITPDNSNLDSSYDSIIILLADNLCFAFLTVMKFKRSYFKSTPWTTKHYNFNVLFFSFLESIQLFLDRRATHGFCCRSQTAHKLLCRRRNNVKSEKLWSTLLCFKQ